MAGSKRVAALAVCLLTVLALVADATAAQAKVCNANALLPCLRAIQGSRPPAPTRQCCDVVKKVDKTCMCNQLKTSTFPVQYVKNSLLLPKKCGREDLRGFKCGSYAFPY